MGRFQFQLLRKTLLLIKIDKDMNKDDIQHLLKGEQTDVQFKERLTDNYDIGCEIVAFCNSRGG